MRGALKNIFFAVDPRGSLVILPAPPPPPHPPHPCSFSELLLLGIAASSPDPAALLPRLVFASFAAVLAANACFHGWVARGGAQSVVDRAIASAAVA